MRRRKYEKLYPAPPPYNAENEAEDARIKGECENRMAVFDRAPRHVRDRANNDGEKIIEKWWRSSNLFNW